MSREDIGTPQEAEAGRGEDPRHFLGRIATAALGHHHHASFLCKGTVGTETGGRETAGRLEQGCVIGGLWAPGIPPMERILAECLSAQMHWFDVRAIVHVPA